MAKTVTLLTAAEAADQLSITTEALLKYRDALGLAFVSVPNDKRMVEDFLTETAVQAVMDQPHLRPLLSSLRSENPEKALHIYEVGFAGDHLFVEAPSAAAAAIWFGLDMFEEGRTNNPFMAAVYSEDGKAWEGQASWMILVPTSADVERVLPPLTDELKRCRYVEGEPA